MILDLHFLFARAWHFTENKKKKKSHLTNESICLNEKPLEKKNLKNNYYFFKAGVKYPEVSRK